MDVCLDSIQTENLVCIPCYFARQEQRFLKGFRKTQIGFLYTETINKNSYPWPCVELRIFFLYGTGVVQLVARSTPDRCVVGLSPTRGTEHFGFPPSAP